MRKTQRKSIRRRRMMGGNCGAGSAAAYVGGLASANSQQGQLNSLMDPMAQNDGYQATTLPAFRSQLGGKRRKHAKKSMKKRGGFGMDMAVPVILVAANQMYKPKKGSVSFRRKTQRRR